MTALNRLLALLARHKVATPLYLLAILAMVILPLPPLVLDLLFTFNIVLAIIIILVLARQKARLKHQQEMARLEKSKLEAEVMASREKLDLFTQTLVEKSSLLEQLQEEAREKKLTSSQQDLLVELTNLTILTDDDWNRFRAMFEKVYPGFFAKLKNTSPDITLDEQRMAALTRLGLSTKQMAAMLGISVESVHKTRQRLRLRFNTDSTAELENIIAAI